MASITLRIKFKLLIMTLLKGSSLPLQFYLLLLSPLFILLQLHSLLCISWLFPTLEILQIVLYTLNVLPFIVCMTGSLSHLSGLSFSFPERGEPPDQKKPPIFFFLAIYNHIFIYIYIGSLLH